MIRLGVPAPRRPYEDTRGRARVEVELGRVADRLGRVLAMPNVPESIRERVRAEAQAETRALLDRMR